MEKYISPHFPEKKYEFDDEFLHAICAAVSNGDDAITYVLKNTTKSYAQFIRWLFEDSARKQIWKDAQSARLEWFTQRTISELKELAFCDIIGIFDENNCVKNISEIPEGTRRAISSIVVEEIFEGYGDGKKLIGYSKQIKFWDKKGSLDSFARHLGMFIDRLAQINTMSDDDSFRDRFFGVN